MISLWMSMAYVSATQLRRFRKVSCAAQRSRFTRAAALLVSLMGSSTSSMRIEYGNGSNPEAFVSTVWVVINLHPTIFVGKGESGSVVFDHRGAAVDILAANGEMTGDTCQYSYLTPMRETLDHVTRTLRDCTGDDQLLVEPL